MQGRIRVKVKCSGWRCGKEGDIIVEDIVSLAVVDHKDIGSGRSVGTKEVVHDPGPCAWCAMARFKP